MKVAIVQFYKIVKKIRNVYAPTGINEANEYIDLTIKKYMNEFVAENTPAKQIKLFNEIYEGLLTLKVHRYIKEKLNKDKNLDPIIVEIINEISETNQDIYITAIEKLITDILEG